MACPNRSFGVLRELAIRRLPQASATRRRADVRGVRRRAHALRDAGRCARVCRSAWPGAAANDACASEGES
ncbi:hypothetical protein DF160_12540 [Burkholderia anthina]|nr:hypothetical protein DF160_12540 [Burkholderia anthina]